MDVLIRARGTATAGWQSGSTSLIETTNAFTLLPQIKHARMSPAGVFQFEFTVRGPSTFSVIATTNPALPLVQWENLGPASAWGDGLFRFTDAAAGIYPQRFYSLR